MTNILRIDFKWFTLAIIVAYVPLHILEEAFGNFPKWMSEHYNLPSPLSYPHWLINNSFFLLTLLAGLYIYFRNREKNLLLGVGILFWGFMNSMEHLVFSVIDFKLSPGLFSALIFLAIFILGMAKLKQMELLKIKLIVASFFIAIGYWVIPMFFIVSLGSSIKSIFP